MPNLFGFRGRIGRGSWWFAHLLYVVAIVVPMVVYALIMNGRRPSPLVAEVTFSLFISFFVLIFISSFFVTAQRLHDRNRSAVWWLLFVPGSSLLGSVAEVAENPLVVMIFGVASLGVSIWALVELGLLRGTIGENRFGPDPLPLGSPTGQSDTHHSDSFEESLEIAEPLKTLEFHDPDSPVTRHAAGTTIVPKGDPAKEMFIVRKGRVRLELDGEAIEEIGPGGIFGETALIDDGPPTVSAIAIEDTEVLPIDTREFLALTQDAPHFALDVIRIHADRLQRMNRPTRQAMRD